MLKFLLIGFADLIWIFLGLVCFGAAEYHVWNGFLTEGLLWFAITLLSFRTYLIELKSLRKDDWSSSLKDMVNELGAAVKDDSLVEHIIEKHYLDYRQK